MIKFLVGVATGWTAARTINPKIESPWKPPTYEQCILLAQKAKKAVEHITEKFEHITEKLEEDDEQDDSDIKNN